jgi:predicted aminopeptidase
MMVIWRRYKVAFACILLGIALPTVAGCELGYAIRQGVYQIRLLSNSRPVQEILADPAVDPQIKNGIRLVQRVKTFGEDHMGLHPSEAYESYIEIQGNFVAYLVTASSKDRLTSFEWRFPIVGSFPYKGFFRLVDARNEIKNLEDRGLDTYLSGAVAFSALGWFTDPLYSSMLILDEVDLVYTILHEMVHRTVFFPDQMDFNEQLATFVGWQGTIAFMEEVYGQDSSQALLARSVVEDEKRLGRFLDWAYARLNSYYAVPMSTDQKIIGRERVFKEIGEGLGSLLSQLQTPRYTTLEEMVWNNASLLLFWRYRYNTGDLEALYAYLEGDLRAMMAMMQTWRKRNLKPQTALQEELSTWKNKKAS